jgi:hypothetical protein
VVLYLPLFIQDVMGQSATNSGTAVTPLTLAMAVSSAIIGQAVARVGRYKWAAILGALLLGGGVYLLAQLTASADIWEVVRDMVVVGLGLGMLMPVLTLAVQNAIPRIRLGAGTGAVTYIRSMGQLLGVAAVGAVATNAFSSALTTRLPDGVKQLPPDAQSKLTDPTLLQRVLGDPSLQHQIIAQAQQQADQTAVPQAVSQIVQQQVPHLVAQQLQAAIAQATAKVPPGPQHAAQVAAITHQLTQQLTPQLTAAATQQLTAQATAQVTAQVNAQVSATLTQLFEAGRQSLALGIQEAFLVSLGICALVLVMAIFLKDVPLAKRVVEAPAVVTRASELRGAALLDGLDVPAAALNVPANGAMNGAASRGLVGARAQERPARYPVPYPAPRPQPAQASTSGAPAALPELTWAALGLTLGALAREAQSNEADPRLLAALSDAVDGRYPHSWSTEERGRAVAREMVAPLATALVSSYVGGHDGANGHTTGPNASYGANGHANGAIGANGTVAYTGAPSAGIWNGTGQAHGGAEYVNGYANGSGHGSYGQPAPESRPLKRVRVTRRLMMDGQVVGEQAIESSIPLDADTETAADELRAKLDAMAPDGVSPEGVLPDEVPTWHQPGVVDQPTLRLR